MRLVGHAAVFYSRSVDLGGFVEVIEPGTFQRTIRDGHPIYAIHHHNFADILGSTRSGALTLAEDNKGLHFELELPDSSLGRDIHALVKRGDLSHMSFSFTVNGTDGESWRETKGGIYERTLHDVDLFEVSTVALPAYQATNVDAREFNLNAARPRMVKRILQARLKAA